MAEQHDRIIVCTAANVHAGLQHPDSAARYLHNLGALCESTGDAAAAELAHGTAGEIEGGGPFTLMGKEYTVPPHRPEHQPPAPASAAPAAPASSTPAAPTSPAGS